MDAVSFDEVFTDTFARSASVLNNKATEYATDVDRLANFKRSADLQKTTAVKALGGKMAKHTISVYDMIESGQEYPIEKWDEKILDHINYLILLRALLSE